MGDWKRVNWAKQPLGIKSDTDIARKLGVPRLRVQKARDQRGIPPAPHTRRCARKGIDWDNEPLGDVPDKELAAKHGVSTVTVIIARNGRGIGSFTNRHGKPARKPKGKTVRERSEWPDVKRKTIDWDAQPLGVESDRQIGIKLGIRSGIVRAERKARGIDVAPGSVKYIKKGVDWNAQPLGQVSDQELADKLGVKKGTVYSARKRRGIALDESALKRASIDWDQEPLGKEPDKLLALMLGCSVSAVAKARAERDIPPHQSRIQKWMND